MELLYRGNNNTCITANATGPNAGCDSTVTLNLTINNSTAGTDVQDVCDNFTWIDGVTYTASNNSATSSLPSNATGPYQGCDSVVTLSLTIRNSTSSLLTVTECDSYTWGLNGQTYTTGEILI